MKVIWSAILTLVCIGTLKAQIQEEKPEGIKFTSNLSWEGLKAKAKAENKLIFLDVYATWCGPCKQMDKEVYINRAVGDFFNAHFIPVKVQTDQTKNDAAEIKAWYQDAKYINQHYEVRELPTFLFLDAEGILVQRDLGFKPVDEFLALGKIAADPNRNFAASRAAYKAGKLALDQLGTLAVTAGKMKEKVLAEQMARDYKTKYLDKQKGTVLLMPANVVFVQTFPELLSSKDPYFQLFWNNPKLADSAFKNSGTAKQLIDYIVTGEELRPVLWSDKQPRDITPDWDLLSHKIAGKYNKDIAKRIILAQQMNWYKARKDWPMTVKYNIEKIERYGLDTAGWGKLVLNNMIYDLIFKHSTDAKALKKAANWMEILIKTDPGRYSWIDTYAGLLYKAGRKAEALTQQEKSVQLIRKQITEAQHKGAAARMLKKYNQDLASYEARLDKMRLGLPTWEDAVD